MSLEIVGLWIAALLTLGAYTILYRENPIYRFVEHLFIGVAAGYGIGVMVADIMHRIWWTNVFHDGKWWWAFALPYAMWLFTIYTEKYSWISRIVIGTLIGAYAGLYFQEFSSVYLPQVRSSFKPLWTSDANPDLLASGVINNIIFLVILLSVMTYFLFSFEQKGGVKRTAIFGRWMLMIALGAIFGNTVMARIALLIGRIWFLMHDWLGIGK